MKNKIKIKENPFINEKFSILIKVSQIETGIIFITQTQIKSNFLKTEMKINIFYATYQAIMTRFETFSTENFIKNENLKNSRQFFDVI